MKKAWLCLFVFIGFGFCFTQVAWADEISDLKAQTKAMEERHQKEMASLLGRLEILETKLAAKAVQGTPGTQGTSGSQTSQLEEQVVELGDRQDQLAKELREKVEMHMYVTFEAENFKTTHSGFDARNVEFLAKAKLNDRLTGFAELELERTNSTSAGNRQGEVEVEQGWLEYYVSDFFKPRFGVVLVPFGRFNLESFDVLQELTDRPIVVRRVVPTAWPEGGAGFTGQASLGERLSWAGLKDLNLNYQAFFVNGLTSVFTDRGLRDASGAFGGDNNNNKAVVGRLGISPWTHQEVGLSGYRGAYDTAGHNITGFDVDWHFEKGPFELVGEWASFGLQNGFETTSGGDLTTIAVPPDMSGVYTELRYHFWFDALNQTFLGRGFKDPTFTLAGRYDHVNIADDGDADFGDNIERRWTIGINYRPVKTWVFKFEYQNNQTRNEALERGNADGFIGSVAASF